MEEPEYFGHAEWRTSTFCSSAGCVEVALGPNSVGMRNSTDPSGPMLVLSTDQWRDFVASVREGTFDLPR